MPSFSKLSASRLATCHSDLQRLFNTVVQTFDCTVLEGERSEATQRENVLKGVSQTMDSRHLDRPSNAVDVGPYPLDWTDVARFLLFGGYVLGVASQLGICVRWGGAWRGGVQRNKPGEFDDLVHFELCKKETQ